MDDKREAGQRGRARAHAPRLPEPPAKVWWEGLSWRALRESARPSSAEEAAENTPTSGFRQRGRSAARLRAQNPRRAEPRPQHPHVTARHGWVAAGTGPPRSPGLGADHGDL